MSFRWSPGFSLSSVTLIITLRFTVSASIEEGGWGRAQRAPRRL